MNPETLRALAAGALCVGLSACAIGPNYQRPSMPLPASFQADGIDWQRVDASQTSKTDGAWWRDFHDDELDSLVAQAQEANQQLAQASAAYRQAQASVRAAQAQYWPTVGADASGSRGSNPLAQLVRQNAGSAASGLPLNGVTHSVTAEASMSWQPDFWGKQRRTVEGQRANAQAQAADLAAARLSITSSVAVDYLSLRQTDNDIVLLERERAVYAQLLDITVRSKAPGTASGDDVLNARNSLDSADATLVNARIARAQYEHALATLCGKPAGSVHIALRHDYRFGEANVPTTLPAQMLRRRPDVDAAERQVAAANAQIGVSEAAYFPSITLSADGGYSSASMWHLFSAPNQLWSLGPQLAETLFDGGARRAQVAQTRASYDASVAAYRQSVLSAVEQVENGLSSLSNLRAQRVFMQQADAQQRQLFAHLQRQQTIGTASQRDVLNGEVLAAQASRTASDAAAQAATASVNLIVALGGTATDPAIAGSASR